MSAGKADFTFEQGATFGPVTVELIDENDAAIDLTEVTGVLFQVRATTDNTDKLLDLSLGAGITIVSPPTLGKLTVTATPAQTTAMEGGGEYDMLLIYSTGTKTRVLEGKVFVSPAVSR